MKIRSARDGALRVLLAVEREQAYANLVLQKLTLSRGMSPEETALLTELVYGVLRQRNHLDWIISQFSKVPLDRLKATVRNILRLGIYQILFLERIPEAAACDEAVKLAKAWKLTGLAGYVNGVLRNVARNREEITYPDPEQDLAGYISIRYSHPRWLVERWLKRFGREETVSLCRVNNQPPWVNLRCNTLLLTREQLIDELSREGIAVVPSPYLPEGVRARQLPGLAHLASFRAGHFVVQDESSMLASRVLNPRPGSLVVDACSGPGGKATHLAQIMRNRGCIIALDVHNHRLQLIRVTAARLGIEIIETRLQDASRMPDELSGQADYLLVDAPCSGLGVIARRPELRWRVAPDELPRHAVQQRAILSGASRVLKKGGVLVYSTCSTEPEENHEVVSALLQEDQAFEPVDITDRIPFPLVLEEDRRSARDGFLQLLPHRHGTDGFFIACLCKRKESA